MNRLLLWTILLLFTLAGTAMALCPTGYALKFDGVDDYVNAGYMGDFAANVDEVTIAAWVKSSNKSSTMFILGTLNGYDGYERTMIRVSLNYNAYGHYDPGYIATFVRDEFEKRLSGSLNWDTGVTDGQWHHVVVAFKCSQNLIRMYLDGIEQTVTYHRQETPLNFANFERPLLIGTINTSTGIKELFDGCIDEVVIFDRILPASEIEALARCAADINDLDLVAYWSFDEGIGQTAHDSSGNGNDGFLGTDPCDVDVSDPNWALSEILPVPDYYVDDDAPDDPCWYDPCFSDPCEDGSFEHPFDSIQEAINQAYIDCNNHCSECNSCCPTILVRDGWYDGSGNYNIDTLGMSLLLKSENGPWSTIVDPYGKGRGFIMNKGESKCTIIDGFLVFDGNPSSIDSQLEPRLGGAFYCEGGGPTIRNCVMVANFALGSGGGIYLNNSDATIYRCEILSNWAEEAAGAGIFIYQSNPVIQNCVVAGNYGYHSGGISCYVDSNATIINCTISDNYARAEYGPDGLKCAHDGHADIKNTIFWTDTRWWQRQSSNHAEPNDSNYTKHIFLETGGSLSISHSDVEGGWEGIRLEDDNCMLDWGIGNLNADPLFARYFFFDYHLKSASGRWTPIAESNGDYNEDDIINFKDFAILAYYWKQPYPPQYVDLDNYGVVDLNDLGIFCSRWLAPGNNTAGWVKDDVNSPCLDAGEPNWPYALEPNPNGARVNMGAYGNTNEASMTTEIAIERRFPDLDDDKDVDFIDFALFANFWLETGDSIEADFDYSNFVNYVDLEEFCRWWLWGK